ncbi:RNA-directed DNA polymerase, eukaryota, reverse transcriptase zinc-binding domain protein [Tanacetum coccineum]|uniref:RNA-directed DNA polymerase, eukaryota, reverse transcriptase zinc-binding domain protein n=1 Tax=Tanacetum coccineum TaxID=301880 RepID=A0ABQ4YNZ1_9ASTR
MFLKVDCYVFSGLLLVIRTDDDTILLCYLCVTDYNGYSRLVEIYGKSISWSNGDREQHVLNVDCYVFSGLLLVTRIDDDMILLCYLCVTGGARGMGVNYLQDGLVFVAEYNVDRIECWAIVHFFAGRYKFLLIPGSNNKAMKERRNCSRIEVVEDLEGNVFLGDVVGGQFFDADFMVRPVSYEEIKAALFSMEDDKALGPDGFSSKFFKASWSVVGSEFTQAIMDYFSNGNLLKEINSIIIALVPKIKTPKKVYDFRPISCCNVLYKCISKIIANRLKGVLNSLVSDCQSAFIPSRQISDNIMLTQELIRNYHRNSGPLKVAFKIDINKAYDFVDWGFLRKSLVYFGFPSKMVHWIMNCMTSPSFTVSVNGEHHGYFRGYRGLRQGYPLSPYLFTLVMEVLSLMINRKIASNEFSRSSGLVPNFEKSMVFFGNVPTPTRNAILKVMPFSVGSFPMRYLKVPLISSRLFRKFYDPLIDKVKQRLVNWKNKVLSFVGRLQLIQSVLSSIQVFWSSIFILSVYVSKEIEKIMRGFLWNQGVMQKEKAKVKWQDVCSLKIQGGLGIESLDTWNIALISKHVWNLVSRKNSLWVKWIKSYRDVLRSHIVTRISNGCNTSAWFDNLCFLGHLSQFISKRDLFEVGLSLDCKVADLIMDGEWVWPDGWLVKFPFLFHLPHPLLFQDMNDKMLWLSNNGKVGNFSVKAVWSDLILVKPVVPWYKAVWMTIITYFLAADSHPKFGASLKGLLIGSVVYMLWQERNLRIFQGNSRIVDVICNIIKDLVRLRLLSLKIKGSAQVLQAAEMWNFHVIDGNGSNSSNAS